MEDSHQAAVVTEKFIYISGLLYNQMFLYQLHRFSFVLDKTGLIALNSENEIRKVVKAGLI